MLAFCFILFYAPKTARLVCYFVMIFERASMAPTLSVPHVSIVSTITRRCNEACWPAWLQTRRGWCNRPCVKVFHFLNLSLCEVFIQNWQGGQPFERIPQEVAVREMGQLNNTPPSNYKKKFSANARTEGVNLKKNFCSPNRCSGTKGSGGKSTGAVYINT